MNRESMVIRSFYVGFIAGGVIKRTQSRIIGGDCSGPPDEGLSVGGSEN